jgi:prepilin-type N-terminal cleavage/methylation domain-containing protein
MKKNIGSRIEGLTLIEILISLAILSIGIVSITGAFSTGIGASGDSENVKTALDIAGKKMEALKYSAFANLSNSGPSADINFPNFNTTVQVSAGQNPMQVNVTVSWKAKGATTSITLTTLVANYT